MSNNALYVYGVVRSGIDLDWQETGINGKKVYMTSKGNFSALFHECKEEPYISENPEEIKKMIVAHNRILDKAMEDFEGVIPLSFNTIIKKGKNSPRFNLKKWLNDDKERLEKIWDKIKGKKEFGIRIYYEKDKLIQTTSSDTKIKEIEKNSEGKGQGLSYLLQGKAKDKINEITHRKINQLKQKFYSDIKKVSKDIKVNISRISIDEERDLLLSLSVLVEEGEIEKIKEILEMNKDFSSQLAGPFAPYSFVENET